MKILVLGGVGAMGIEATRDLALTSSFDEIAIADLNLDKAKEVAAELGGGRVRACRADASDEASLAKLFGGYDVVLNCTSYVFGLHITKAALAAEKPLLDLGGLYNTPKQLALAGEDIS